jgi:hypothetical protein
MIKRGGKKGFPAFSLGIGLMEFVVIKTFVIEVYPIPPSFQEPRLRFQGRQRLFCIPTASKMQFDFPGGKKVYFANQRSITRDRGSANRVAARF